MSRARGVPVLVAAAVLASALTVSPPTVGTAVAEDAYTAVYLDGEIGEPVSFGRPHTFFAPAETIDATPEPERFQMSVNLGAYLLAFYAPIGSTLAVGTYPDAVNPNDRQPGQAGIDIHGSSTCNSYVGSFTVHEWTVVADVITSVAISFQQRCDGNTSVLHGEVRWNSTLPLKAGELAPLSPYDFGIAEIGDPGAPMQDVTLTATGTQPLAVEAVTLTGTNADDFSVLGETCTSAPVAVGGSCTVTVQATPNSVGELEAALVLDDDSFRGSKALKLLVFARYHASNVSWSGLRSAPNWSWTTGSSLARTTASGTEWLHASYATDRIGNTWASDDGAKVGVYYIRSSNGGSAWSTAKRLNPTNVHGLRGAMAASGSHVYATWISIRRWNDYAGKDPRVLYFRRNSGHGKSSGWSNNIQLSPSRGRVDAPTVAAAGTHVYVAYTNSGNGDVILKVSHDRGRTWKDVKLGTTRLRTGDGYTGWPRVSAAGSLVGVSWTAGSDGRVKARVSTNAGRSWSGTTQLTGSANDISSSAATGSRFAVAWTNGHDAQIRLWEGGAWSPKRTAPPPLEMEWGIGYGATVALNGDDRIGVAWSACMDDCNSQFTYLVNLIWTESDTDGTTWAAGQIISNWSADNKRRYAEYPSVIWPSATSRYIYFNTGALSPNVHYQMYVKKGTGSL